MPCCCMGTRQYNYYTQVHAKSGLLQVKPPNYPQLSWDTQPIFIAEQVNNVKLERKKKKTMTGVEAKVKEKFHVWNHLRRCFCKSAEQRCMLETSMIMRLLLQLWQKQSLIRKKCVIGAVTDREPEIRFLDIRNLPKNVFLIGKF